MKRTLFDRFFPALLVFLIFGVFAGAELYAQTSGQIYKPATSTEGRSILDPNSTGNVFNSGVQFHPLPQLQSEPTGDVRTGAKGGHTDLVSNSSGESAAYMAYDADKQALLFRVRLGGQSTASKGYSFLFNTNFDLFGPKAGNFTTTNPGFQFEVVLETNNGVTIYQLDGSGTTAERRLTPIDNYFQKAVSDQMLGSSSNGYFYDFYVPISEINALPGITFNTGTTFRPVGITITSAQSGITGTISDVAGINDNLFKSTTNALINIIESTPEVTVTQLDQLSNTKPRAPNLFGPLLAGSSQTVSGSSLETDVTIQLYVNGVNVAQTASFSGNNWSISGVNLQAEDQVYAIATRGSAESDKSTTLIVGFVVQCTVEPSNYTRSGNTFTGQLIGVQGVEYTNASTNNLTIRIYNLNGNITHTTAASDGVGTVVNLTAWNAGTQTFTLDGSGNPFNQLTNGNYYVTAQVAGQCESSGGTDEAVKTDAPVITTSSILTSTTSISGTAVANSTVTLYQNATQIGSTTANGSGNWTVSSFSEALVENRFITARAQSAGEAISDPSNAVIVGTLVIEQTSKPYIDGSYTATANSDINGFAFEPQGTVIRVFVDDNFVGQTTVDIYGSWELTGIDLTGKGGIDITATAQAEGKTVSEKSDPVTIASMAQTSPPTIFGNDDEVLLSNARTVTVSNSEGTVRIYRNGTEVASGSGSSVSIPGGVSIEPGDELYATNQGTGKSESEPSNYVLVIPNVVYYIGLESVNPNSVNGGGGIESTFTFKVLNGSFTNANNVTVEFEITNGEGSRTPASSTTNSEGLVSVVYTTNSADDESTVTIRASVKDNGDVVDQTTGSLVVGEAPAGPHTLSLSGPSSVIAGQASSNFTISLVNSEGGAINATQSTVFNLSTSQESGSATFNPTQVTIAAGNSSGTFTYTNTQVGSGSHTITATRASGDELAGGNSDTHSITVTAALSTTVAVATTGLTVNHGYDAFTPVTASGGTGSYTFTLRNADDTEAGVLPAGMSFNTSTGQISGTATATQGSTTYTVSVSDGVGTSSKTFSLTVNAAPAGDGTISDVSLVPAETKVAQANLNDVFTGGTGSLSFSASSGDTDLVTVSLDGNQLSVTGVTNGGPVVVTVTATDANGATATQTFNVTVTVNATRLVVTGSSTQTAGTAQSLTITARDGDGNVATTYTGDKTLTFFGAGNAPNGTKPTITDKNGSATEFGEETTITFTNGVASVSGGNNGVMTLYAVGSSVIAVQDQDEIAAAGGDRLTVTVTHGAFETFAVSLSSPQSSGSTFTETNTITARDSWGNTVTNFDASATPVTLTTTLGGTISGLGSDGNNIINRESDFTNGVANLSGNIIYTGSTGTGTFTATADGKSGTSSNITISAGTPSQIAINGGNNQSATIGTAVSTNPNVIVRDAANNPVQGISITFSVTSGGGSLTDAVATTNSNGIATVGGWTLGSSVGTNALSASITGSNPSISTSFSAEGLPVPDLSVDDLETNDTTPVITGLSNQPEGRVVTVTLKDSAGNDVVDGSGSPVSYTGTVDAEGKWSITVTNPLAEGVYEATATVVDGSGATRSATGSVTIDTTPPLLSVNDTSTNSTTPTITGTSNQPEGSEVTVVLKDSEGNSILGSDGNPLSYTTTVGSDGSWSVNITNELGIAIYTVEATTTDKVGNTTTSTGNLTIEEDEPGLVISVADVIVPGGRIGNITTITVTLQDQNGNPISGRTDLLGFGLSGSNGDVQLSEITDNGDGTYSVSYTPVVNGDDQITITLDGVAIEGSPFTSRVTEDAWKLVFTQSPNRLTEAGFPFGTVIVELRNSDGDRIAGYSGAVTIQITEDTGGPIATDAQLIGTTTVNAVNGVATFEGIMMERSGFDYTLTATANEVDSGISDPFSIIPGPPWQLVIRVYDDLAALINDFYSSLDLSSFSKILNGVTADNEVQLEGNRIPMYMVILDEFENITFVEEGDTPVDILSSSPSGRFFLEQTSNNPISKLVIPRNQRITTFYYEDPRLGELTISGTPVPPAGAREIRPGETPIVIRKPGRIRATPDDIFSEINVREEILISLQDENGQRVYAPDPGVTIEMSSTSAGGQFYATSSGGTPITSTIIAPAETSVKVFYQDSFTGTHTLTFNGAGVPEPTDRVQFTIEQAGTLSALSIAGPDTLSAGEQGGVYRLILQDEYQNEIVSDEDLTFDLNLEDGVNATYYFEVENNLQTVSNNQLTIPAGSSYVPFYLSQNRAGDKILHAKSKDDEIELSADKPIHFTPNFDLIILAMVAGNGQQELVTHLLSEDLTVTIIDQFENPITEKEVIFSLVDSPFGASAMELMLSTEKKQSNKSVASKILGNMDVTVMTDSTGMAAVSFVVGDRSGDYIIKATSPGLEPVEFVVSAISLDYMLHQNYSNPFNNNTRIKYEVPELSDVKIEVYDMIGRRIAVLINDTRDLGIYEIDFDAARFSLSTGVYFYRMTARSAGNDNGYSMVRRMVYVK